MSVAVSGVKQEGAAPIMSTLHTPDITAIASMYLTQRNFSDVAGDDSATASPSELSLHEAAVESVASNQASSSGAVAQAFSAAARAAAGVDVPSADSQFSRFRAWVLDSPAPYRRQLEQLLYHVFISLHLCLVSAEHNPTRFYMRHHAAFMLTPAQCDLVSQLASLTTPSDLLRSPLRHRMSERCQVHLTETCLAYLRTALSAASATLPLIVHCLAVSVSVCAGHRKMTLVSPPSSTDNTESVINGPSSASSNSVSSPAPALANHVAPLSSSCAALQSAIAALSHQTRSTSSAAVATVCAYRVTGGPAATLAAAALSWRQHTLVTCGDFGARVWCLQSALAQSSTGTGTGTDAAPMPSSSTSAAAAAAAAHCLRNRHASVTAHVPLGCDWTVSPEMTSAAEAQMEEEEIDGDRDDSDDSVSDIWQQYQQQRQRRQRQQVGDRGWWPLLGHIGTVYDIDYCEGPDDNGRGGGGGGARGEMVVTAGEDTTVRLWHVDSADTVSVYNGHSYPVWSLACQRAPGAQLFVTGSMDGTARLWTYERPYPLRVFVGHSADVDCVDIHANGNYVCSASGDGSVRLWCCRSGCQARHLTDSHRGVTHAVVFSPDGRLVATAGEDSAVRVFELASGKLLHQLLHAHGGRPVRCLAWSRDSSCLVSGDSGGTIVTHTVTVDKASVCHDSILSNAGCAVVSLQYTVHNYVAAVLARADG